MLDTLCKVSLGSPLQAHRLKIIARNLKTLGQYISEEDYNYLMSLEHIGSEAEVAKFREWCQTHSVKAVRGNPFPITVAYSFLIIL